jgi:putative ABC transport system substrate-binding protein
MVELLKRFSELVRVGVLRNPAIPAAIGQFAVIQAAAPSLGVEVSALNIHHHTEIPGVIAGFARGTNDGLIVTASVFAVRGRDLIIAEAAKRKLPTAYYGRHFVDASGLISYGPNSGSIGRAAYVDRILRVRSPATFRFRHRLRARDQPEDGKTLAIPCRPRC